MSSPGGGACSAEAEARRHDRAAGEAHGQREEGMYAHVLRCVAADGVRGYGGAVKCVIINGSACMADHSTAESRGEEWVDLGVVCGFTTMRALPRDLAVALRGRDRERRREKREQRCPAIFCGCCCSGRHVDLDGSIGKVGQRFACKRCDKLHSAWLDRRYPTAHYLLPYNLFQPCLRRLRFSTHPTLAAL